MKEQNASIKEYADYKHFAKRMKERFNVKVITPKDYSEINEVLQDAEILKKLKGNRVLKAIKWKGQIFQIVFNDKRKRAITVYE